MRATASTPTGTRWLWCSGAAVLAISVLACAPRREFRADSAERRLDTVQLRDEATAILRTECPRLMGGDASAAGETHVRVEVASGGSVQRAWLTRSSGDERIDELFGSLASRLEFPPPDDGTATTANLRLGYSCSPEASVASLQIVGD